MRVSQCLVGPPVLGVVAAVAIGSEQAANAVQHTGSTDVEAILALFSKRVRVAVRGSHPSPTPDLGGRPDVRLPSEC